MPRAALDRLIFTSPQQAALDHTGEKQGAAVDNTRKEQAAFLANNKR
jgi:hypothetical protein